MNQIVIFLVPTGASQQDFEAALGEYIPSLEVAGTQTQTKPTDLARRGAEEPPLWTWFLPNPCPLQRRHLAVHFQVNFPLQSLS